MFFIILTTILVILFFAGVSAGVAMYMHLKYLRPVVNKAKSMDKKDILTNGFSQKKVKDMGKFDCIVIGSGMGGLTAAALLARIGKKVLLLEQHDVLGGCTHTFDENGFEFDTGLHYLGKDVTGRYNPMGFLLYVLGMGNIQWSKMGKTYDHAIISPELSKQKNHCRSEPTQSASAVNSLEFTENFEDTVKRLIAAFPEEEDAIRSYLRLLQWSKIVFPIFIGLKLAPKLIGSFVGMIFGRLINAYMGTSTKQVLRSLTKNEDLIGVLTYMWADYGLPPKDSAFVMTAVLAEHFKDGAYYPTGGSAKMAENIVPVILAAGGTEALGVHCRGMDILAPCVISATGVMNTYFKLIRADDDKLGHSKPVCPHAEAVRRHLHVVIPPTDGTKSKDTAPDDIRTVPVEKVGPSLSMFSLFVGFNGSAEELGIEATNKWLFPHWRHDEAVNSFQESAGRIQSKYRQELLASETEQDSVVVESVPGSDPDEEDLCPYLPVVFISSPSAKDDDWKNRHEGRAVMEVITGADFMSYWDVTPAGKTDKVKHRGGRYEVMKSQMEKKLLRIVEEQYPLTKGRVTHVSSGTPMTNNFYLGSINGEVYGLNHTPTRFTTCDWFLRPKTPIKGLYLSGQDILCNGIVGAMGGGALAAVSVSSSVLFDLVVTFVSECL